MAKRKKIGLEVKLASALLTLRDIPYEDAKLMTAAQICSLYQFDHHPVLKAHDGPDEPWNLVPRLILPHREKSKKDAGIIAKVKRLRAAPKVRAGVPKQKDEDYRLRKARPKRRIAQRANPWPPKGSRKILTRRNFPAGHSTVEPA